MDASRDSSHVYLQGGSRYVSPTGIWSQRGDYGEDGSVLHDMKVLPTRA
jgi:hypothetical protein